jgi:flagellar biosynthesis protein FliR
MSILPNALHKSQEAVCGTMLVNILGLTGTQISTAAVFLSFLGMAIGLGIWHQTDNKSDSEIPRIVQALGFVVILTMFAASMSWWTAAIVLSVLTILLMVISIRFAIA